MKRYLALLITFVLFSCEDKKKDDTVSVTDIDGNVYSIVKIGNQVWMAENLRVTKYRNGDTISDYSAYDDIQSNAEIYGYLYGWDAVKDNRNIAPEGWHVPTDEEWMELEQALGMNSAQANSRGFRGTNEASKLAGNADLWDDDELISDSEFGASGFNALPGGFRSGSSSSFGQFSSMGVWAFFWSSTPYNNYGIWGRALLYSDIRVRRGDMHIKGRLSIRCVKD